MRHPPPAAALRRPAHGRVAVRAVEAARAAGGLDARPSRRRRSAGRPGDAPAARRPHPTTNHHDTRLDPADPRQRPRRHRARGPPLPHRGRQPLVSRRLAERVARPHRPRPPLRAPDVRGLPAPRPQLLHAPAAGRGRRQRVDELRPHELLGGRPRQRPRPRPVARVRPHGLPAAGPHRGEVREPARRGAERAPPAVREPALRAGPDGPHGRPVPARPPVPLDHHRRGRGHPGRHPRRRPRVLPRLVPPRQRVVDGGRRRRDGGGDRRGAALLRGDPRRPGPAPRGRGRARAGRRTSARRTAASSAAARRGAGPGGSRPPGRRKSAGCCWRTASSCRGCTWRGAARPSSTRATRAWTCSPTSSPGARPRGCTGRWCATAASPPTSAPPRARARSAAGSASPPPPPPATASTSSTGRSAPSSRPSPATVRAEEIERALAQVEAQFVYGLQTVGGFHGRSDQLNAYNVYTGDPGFVDRDLARYRGTGRRRRAGPRGPARAGRRGGVEHGAGGRDRPRARRVGPGGGVLMAPVERIRRCGGGGAEPWRQRGALMAPVDRTKSPRPGRLGRRCPDGARRPDPAADARTRPRPPGSPPWRSAA